MHNVTAIPCHFVRMSEYNGRPQAIFRLPEGYGRNEFSVYADDSTNPNRPSDNALRWYLFGADVNRFKAVAVVYLGQMEENFFREG